MVEKITFPLVSIVLCTYNGEKYLSIQLDSLLNQTYPNLEIIICDDCSTDNTFEILKKYQSQNDNLSIFRNDSNLGFNKNFEKSILLSKGKYIAICDQDDEWMANKIELMMNKIGDSLLLYSNSEKMNESGNLLNSYTFNDKTAYSGNNPRYFAFLNIVSGHNILLNRELLDYILPVPENSFYDWWFALVAANLGKLSVINDVLVKHRVHQSSVIESKQLLAIGTDIEWTSAILSLENLKHRPFFEKLLEYQEQKMFKGKSINLYCFALKHMKILYFFNPKSYFSKLNLIRKILK